MAVTNRRNGKSDILRANLFLTLNFKEKLQNCETSACFFFQINYLNI